MLSGGFRSWLQKCPKTCGQDKASLEADLWGISYSLATIMKWRCSQSKAALQAALEGTGYTSELEL